MLLRSRIFVAVLLSTYAASADETISSALSNEAFPLSATAEGVRRFGPVYSWELEPDIPFDPTAHAALQFPAPYGPWAWPYSSYWGLPPAWRAPWVYGRWPAWHAPWLSYGYYGRGHWINPGVMSQPYASPYWPYAGPNPAWAEANLGFTPTEVEPFIPAPGSIWHW